MVVLVSGGAGYLGSRLIRDLPRMSAFRGETIRILDNMFRERYVSLWNLPKGVRYEFLEGDVRDEADVRRALQDVDMVFSLSDITNAPISFDRKKLTWEVNHDGALNLFIKALRSGVQKFVYTSTCSVYGPTQGVVTEDSPCAPISPYAESKLAAEKDMRQQAWAVGFNWTALRLGTVHGWTIGMRFDTVANRFAYLAAQGRPLSVYSSAWNEKRPYVHVSDVMSAYRIAATLLGGTFNVVGENADIKAIVAAIRTVIPETQVVTTETPSLNQLSYEVDGSKFEALGFKAKTTLQAGIQEVIARFLGIVESW